MSKFSYEEKIRAARLVEAGETFGSVSRQTGISPQVIREKSRTNAGLGSQRR